jgi:hypothetical protein
MSIDLTVEPPIPLADVPRLTWLRGRGGRRLHVATVHRWCTRGIRGARLEFVQRGGTRVTTEAALVRFFRTLTFDDCRPADSASGRREKQLQAVERKLDVDRF